MVGVAAGPLIGKFIDGWIPWYASVLGIAAVICTQAIQVGAGGIHVAAVVVVTVGIDVFRQMLQTSLAAKIFSIQPDARARLNAVFILSVRLPLCSISYNLIVSPAAVHWASYGYCGGNQDSMLMDGEQTLDLRWDSQGL